MRVKLSRAGTFQEDLHEDELIGRPQAKIKKFAEKIDKLTSDEAIADNESKSKNGNPHTTVPYHNVPILCIHT